MTQKIRTIRPGLLVGLKTRIAGGVRYVRTEIDDRTDGVREVVEWKTTKTVDDAEQHKAATRVRLDARREIARVCSATSFGLLCPRSEEEALDAAIARAQRMVILHNQEATTSRIELYVLKGRVAEDDEQAARAVASEIRDLIDDMDAAIKKADPAAIRDAATQARQMMAVLSEEKQEIAGKAIEAARKAARDIVRRVEKKGEDIAAVLVEIDGSAIQAARLAFLDMGDQQVPEVQPAAEAAPRVIDTEEAAEAAPLPAVELRRFDVEVW